ncbi:hypothetical protein KEM56_003895 [Ascosphaera pollenicola]|nr:hypothetical protein KEM56_003895 [Ascosphaera pollenicola]
MGNQYIQKVCCTRGFPRDDMASEIMAAVAELVKPVMEKFRIELNVLSELHPRHQRSSHCMTEHDKLRNCIYIRIRAFDNEGRFLPKDIIMNHTILELAKVNCDIASSSFERKYKKIRDWYTIDLAKHTRHYVGKWPLGVDELQSASNAPQSVPSHPMTGWRHHGEEEEDPEDVEDIYGERDDIRDRGNDDREELIGHPPPQSAHEASGNDKTGPASS